MIVVLVIGVKEAGLDPSERKGLKTYYSGEVQEVNKIVKQDLQEFSGLTCKS